MGLKNFLQKNKRIIISVTIALLCGVFVGPIKGIPRENYEILFEQSELLAKEVSLSDYQIKSLEDEIEDLKEEKIEKEKLEREEAERIAKEEAERVAKEEADKKAEEEQLKKEEENQSNDEKEIESESNNENNDAIDTENIPEESGSGDSVSNNSDLVPNNNATEVPQERNVGDMVWISETGSKYHSKNNCGRMNPEKAVKMSLEEAIARGYTACSKCY